MSAFSTVSDVFSDPEFSASGHSCLWGLGALDEQHRNVLVFLSCPSVHTNGVWIRMAAIKLTILRLALAPGISLLTFPSSSTSAIQISLGLIALCEVGRPSKEDLNADATKNVGRDEVLVCALRFAFSLCLFLSPNVRSCWSDGAKTATCRESLLR